MTRRAPAPPPPPPTERRFANGWGELDYLCRKIRYWLYTRKQRSKAEVFAGRLEHVLRSLPQDDCAILLHDGRALLFELKGDLARSMRHRDREIQLMEALERESRSARYSESTRAYILRDRGPEALEERRAILAALAQAMGRQHDKVGRGARHA